MFKICILDSKTLGKDISLNEFSKFGELTIYETTKNEEIIDRIKDKDIIITNKVILNENNLKFAKSLKLICLTATGTNNIDLKFTKSKNIIVKNVPGYSTESVAQHTFAMLFYILESLEYYNEYVKSKKYTKEDIFTNLNKTFYELNNKTWGIIGLGTIGNRVANLAKAFNCKVIFYSTSGNNNNQYFIKCSLNELLENSDIVSIHAPLNEKTQNLITYEKIKLMKKNAILLNVGRGGIVNEKDLACALDQDLIFGAALDVLQNEPILEDNPLLKLKNKNKLLITPHIAWGSIEARQRLIEEVFFNIEAFLKKESRNEV